MTRALIVDDEAPARRMVRDALAASGAAVAVVGECAHGAAAVEAVAAAAAAGAPVGLLFLDVQMPGMGGFEALAEIERRALPLPRVVFATAFDRHAVRAFDVAAADYLLKPFTQARFEAAVARALNAPAAPAPSYPERILVERGGALVPLAVADVLWVEAAGDYAVVHARRGAFVAAEGIGALAARLDPARIARVHRSALLALDAVRALERDGSGGFFAHLDGGATVRVSRTYAAAVGRRRGRAGG